ncbi:glucose-1-phosphate adenylyltransferase subunit GlgD [Agrilactobacillus yilanensis]|uniref:Glucose-1-phosphate adenylyltransferase subunit GlgD n=1 Tax=Agrilactobacillus yilanensis TaxID=2485997 RepID=A0ABW4JAJ3_9LACO|nr:glucose-1-phosphate adenylyltransferase subunit GlgD [Agrilactobacillus yilanensis]
MRQSDICAIIDLNVPSEALEPLTQYRPIGTLPFAGRYRLIDFPLSDIANAGIRDVGMYMPASSRSVQDHVRSGSTWNLDTITGGIFTFPYVATKNYNNPLNRQRYYDDYLTFLKKSNTRFTVIISARNIENINLQEVLQFHLEGNAPITTLYKRQLASGTTPDEDALKISAAGEVSNIVTAGDLTPDAKTHTLPMAMGVYMLRTSLLIEMVQNASEQEDFIRLPKILEEAVSVYNANAYEYTGFYANINSIKRYFDANMAMLEEANYQALLYSQRHIFTKNKNEVPTFFSDASEVNNSLLGTGGWIEGKVNESVIFRRSRIAKGAEIDHSVLMQGCKVGENTKLRYVILDKGVVVGPNLTLEGTPEEPLVYSKNAIVETDAKTEEGRVELQ